MHPSGYINPTLSGLAGWYVVTSQIMRLLLKCLKGFRAVDDFKSFAQYVCQKLPTRKAGRPPEI